MIEHYTDLLESTRLTRSPHGRLEYLRVQEIVRRTLPTHARVLDVGGATGVHAEWLARDGHQVHVVDPVPEHVEEAARIPCVTASVGDARHLREEAGSQDVVLLFGPLYHLTEPADRRRALRAARLVETDPWLVNASAHLLARAWLT